MDMSVPYNPTVVNLSLSDPACINAGDECNAYYAAQNASQDTISWAYQFEYGHWATYYYVISEYWPFPSPSIVVYISTPALSTFVSCFDSRHWSLKFEYLNFKAFGSH